MEDIRKGKILLKDTEIRPWRLWCGKVQSLCDGTLCTSCHMFPSGNVNISDHSILSTPTLVDHGSIGLIRDEEE